MISFGHDLAIAHMNPQQLWLPTQDLCKIKSVEKLLCGLGRAPRTLRSYGQLMAAEQEGITFL